GKEQIVLRRADGVRVPLDQIDLIRIFRDDLLHRLPERNERIHLVASDDCAPGLERYRVEIDTGRIVANALVLQHLVQGIGPWDGLNRWGTKRADDVLSGSITVVDDVATLRNSDDRRRHVIK